MFFFRPLTQCLISWWPMIFPNLKGTPLPWIRQVGLWKAFETFFTYKYANTALKFVESIFQKFLLHKMADRVYLQSIRKIVQFEAYLCGSLYYFFLNIFLTNTFDNKRVQLPVESCSVSCFCIIIVCFCFNNRVYDLLCYWFTFTVFFDVLAFFKVK